MENTNNNDTDIEIVEHICDECKEMRKENKFIEVYKKQFVGGIDIFCAHKCPVYPDSNEEHQIEWL